jgi:hypothetical protein
MLPLCGGEARLIKSKPPFWGLYTGLLRGSQSRGGASGNRYHRSAAAAAGLEAKLEHAIDPRAMARRELLRIGAIGGAWLAAPLGIGRPRDPRRPLPRSLAGIDRRMVGDWNPADRGTGLAVDARGWRDPARTS